MLEGRSILCFAHDWDGDPTSKTHIMRILSRRNRVVWVNSIGMRRPQANGRDLRRLGVKLWQGLRPCRQVDRTLWVVNPLALPFPGHRLVDGTNALLLAARIKGIVRRHLLQPPIVWTFVPTVAPLIGRLPQSMLVYHCVDEYAAFAGMPVEVIRSMEARLVQAADLVFASSERLAAERARLNPRTTFISHGVDLEHFSKARASATPLAPELVGLKRPIIGFIGLVAEWVDTDLVHALARAEPSWNFVLVGRATVDVSSLRALPNVLLLGRRPYARLPEYCRGFDAGIVPFRRSELTERANPLKLREYLAAGLPVVSTPLPEVSRYAHLVHLAETVAEFRQALRTVLQGPGPDPGRQRRVEAMRPESWESRVEQISQRILSHSGSAS